MTLSNVPVKFTAGGAVIHEEMIASLAPGGSQSFMFDWDVTSLLAAGGSPLELTLLGTVDPADAILETNEGNNSQTTTERIDVEPQVVSVTPQYTLDGHYFLDNQSVSNLIAVVVDWNGDLPGMGAAPFGTVHFDLNGAVVDKAGTAVGASHTYDMGSDFNSSLSCANNTLKIWAENGGVSSAITTIQPTVFPFPEWVEWVVQNIPGSDATFQTTAKAPLVEYNYAFKYPEPAFEATWDVPAAVPYLGGKKIGILETQAAATALGRSNGLGEIGLSGGTGLGLAAVDVAGEVGGVGEVQFKCGESLDLLSTTLTLNVNATIEKELNLTDLFPPLAAAEGWAVVGSVVAWINRTAEVNASIQPAIEIETTFVDNEADELVFESGEGTGSVAMEASLSVAPVDGLEVSVTGGGTPYVTVQVPANPSYLKEVGIILTFEAMLEAWFFEAGYETEVNCNSNGGCSVVSDEDRGPLFHEPQLMTRDYAGVTYDIYLAPGRQPDGVSSLIANIYPRPETALAIRADGERLVAAIHDDVTKDVGRGTEVRVLHYDGASWNAPVSVTSDDQPDFNPALAFDGSGNGLLVWERSMLSTEITPSLDITFAQSLEIYSSVWNGITWTTPISLTDNGLMDHAPQLARGGDGTVVALWQSNDGTDMLGTVGHTVEVNTAVWNGSAWDSPLVALSGQVGLLRSELAVNGAGEAAVVVVKIDGDTELHYTTFNGATWSGLSSLTANGVEDEAPQLVYDSDGNRHLVWRQDGQLLWLKNSWVSGEAQVILSEATQGGFLEMRLTADGNGNLALVWPAQTGDHPELVGVFYDGSADQWSQRRVLTEGAAVEGAFAPAFDPDGGLAVAYRRTARSLGVGGNGAQNVPQWGASELLFLTRPITPDLTVDSLTAFPLNVAPGGSGVLTAVVRNDGDLTVASAELTFFAGGSPIVTRTVGSLAAGVTATVTTTWVAPAVAVSQTLTAVVDPQDLIVEGDEGNNQASVITTLPDLEIDVLYTAHHGAGITVTARLRNGGVIAVGDAVSLTLRAGNPVSGTVLGTVAVPDVAAGGMVTVTESIPLAMLGSLTGEDRLWAVVDSSDGVLEADEGNNGTVVLLNLLPDLLVAAADVAGGTELISVTVHNVGVVSSGSTILAVDGGGDVPDGGVADYSAVVPVIPAGGHVVVTVEVPEGMATYGVKVDPGNLLAEVREGNNGAVREVAVTTAEEEVYLPLIFR